MHLDSVTGSMLFDEAVRSAPNAVDAADVLDAAGSIEALQARLGGPQDLAQALQAARRDSLALFDAFARALPELRVPYHPTLNPPLWELGHIGWFQTRWLERHPHWREGPRADPTRPLRGARAAQADALFDSSTVEHARRWHLPLPDTATLKTELARGLAHTLQMLEDAASAASTDSLAPPAMQASSDEALYFFRLCLLHEDMHHEAGLYMARALGMPVPHGAWQARVLADPPPPLRVPAGRWRSTGLQARGFAFDNERGTHEVEVPAFEIDAQAVRWAEFLPFVEAGGYQDRHWWTPEGWRWLCTEQAHWREIAAQGAPQAEAVAAASPHSLAPMPRYLRLRPALGAGSSVWETWHQGRWSALELREAACHLSAHEAHAWCAWAGRRLPSEFEWERALSLHPKAFVWGDVWEWTASPFAPFPGFEPHPYREYSAPWFDGRPVLKGASHLSQARMRHPRYRNFFGAARNDLAAGFRSCAS